MTIFQFFDTFGNFKDSDQNKTCMLGEMYVLYFIIYLNIMKMDYIQKNVISLQKSRFVQDYFPSQ
jgi:hypothetical protein